jgi:pyruvate/2-oxoglutarate dehydrogenase complex dihydrolipoamide dehydrogenase (E3) component
METADLIVIGSGQGGIPLTMDFAKAGHKVVTQPGLVDRYLGFTDGFRWLYFHLGF